MANPRWDRVGRIPGASIIALAVAWIAFVEVHPRKSFARAATQVELGMTPSQVHSLMAGFPEGPEDVVGRALIRLKRRATPNAACFEPFGGHHGWDEFLWVGFGPDGKATRVLFGDD